LHEDQSTQRGSISAKKILPEDKFFPSL